MPAFPIRFMQALQQSFLDEGVALEPRVLEAMARSGAQNTMDASDANESDRRYRAKVPRRSKPHEGARPLRERSCTPPRR